MQSDERKDPSLASTLAERRASNWDLLELVLGSWRDQDGSCYSVQFEGGRELNSCSVFTTRPSGKTICTKGLIRACKQQVLWASSYKLDSQNASAREVVWIHRDVGKEFRWHRQTCKLQTEDLVSKVIAERSSCNGDAASGELDAWRVAHEERAELRKRLALQREAHNQEAFKADMACESDDDDVYDNVDDNERKSGCRVAVPVNDVSWCQDTICIRFRDGRLLFDTLHEMLKGSLLPEDLPPFQVVLHEDQLFAVTGNRRLWALREFQRLTGRQVSVTVKCYPPAAMEKPWCRRRFTTKCEGATIEFVHRRSGKERYATMRDALCADGLHEHAVSLESLQDGNAQQNKRRCESADNAAETPGSLEFWQESEEDDVTNRIAQSALAALLSKRGVPINSKALANETVIGSAQTVSTWTEAASQGFQDLPFFQSQLAQQHHEPSAFQRSAKMVLDSLAEREQLDSDHQTRNENWALFSGGAWNDDSAGIGCIAPVPSWAHASAQQAWQSHGYAEHPWATYASESWPGTQSCSNNFGVWLLPGLTFEEV